MTDPRQAFLAEARERGFGPAVMAALERTPEHFIATAAAIAEGSDHEAVLVAFCELLTLSIEHQRRRADAAEAQLAEQRRHGLHIAPDPPAMSTIPRECEP